MGKKAEVALELGYEELITYLRENHSAYMESEGKLYYLTDCNDHYWRAQDTEQLNHKDHFVDCSELVPTVSEFVELPFVDGKSVKDLFEGATFFASEK